ncbi:DUF4365 domain-containing protein [Methylomonas sp. MK1]|uniref:DUF4365 domain-containing protein n=1 Tax=Methylomonas sp. MK1 TaxID=1131552 RepID=UPI0003629992|nr:DUF4365 domain-containing protein [Methylomonas sp. MK1]
MTNAFPKRLTTDKISEIGVNLVSTIINDIYGWVFRKTHLEHDYGVDAYIDFVTDDGFVTGKFIAAQIKTGQSYLSKNGNTHWYVDSKEHLNYFLNLPVPILLIVCDPDKKECFWARLDKDHIDFREKNWRHPIPKNQRLSSTYKDSIIKIFGKIEDHISDFERDNELMEMTSNDSFIQYCIPKYDIEKRNIRNLRDFISRITRNEKLTLAVQGRLYICTYGYEDDIREVHQIKEVRRWVKKRERI